MQLRALSDERLTCFGAVGSILIDPVSVVSQQRLERLSNRGDGRSHAWWGRGGFEAEPARSRPASRPGKGPNCLRKAGLGTGPKSSSNSLQLDQGKLKVLGGEFPGIGCGGSC